MSPILGRGKLGRIVNFSDFQCQKINVMRTTLILFLLFSLSSIGFAQRSKIVYKNRRFMIVDVTWCSLSELSTKQGNVKLDLLDTVFFYQQPAPDHIVKSLTKRGIYVGYQNDPEKSYLKIYTSKHPGFVKNVPITEDGKLVFTEVVQVEGVSAKDFYVRAKNFYTDIFKSAQDVIQLDDKEAGVVVGKAWTPLIIQTGLGGVETRMWYTLKIACKDGRYKYEIYDVYYQSYATPYTSSTDTPAEGIFLKENYYRKNGTPKSINESYCERTLLHMVSLIIQLKEKMASGSKTGADDW
jgi:hypothetical protein